MLATISYSGPQSTDLGYLLYKHPSKVQTFDMSVGRAHVFYPEATDERCTFVTAHNVLSSICMCWGFAAR